MDPGEGLTEKYVALPDGRRLRTIVAGAGDRPLVVFEAGMSAPAASWIHTQREISAYARTLSYDRAGYGGSDIDPHDRTLERIVDDLTYVLQGERVVLVGHSWGGPIVRLFCERHPEQVAGLVFVDASVAEVMSAANARTIAFSFVVTSMLIRLGAGGLIRKLTLPHPSPEISAADFDIVFRDYASTRAMRAGRQEAAQIVRAIPTMRRLQAAGTPDVPTICLQAGRVDRGMAKARAVFNQVVADLMAAAPDGRCDVVEGTGHLMPQENPAVVREAILEVSRRAVLR